MNYILKVRLDYLVLIISNIKLINYHHKGEKSKNKGISGVIVIRLIAIMERFLSKI